MWKGRFKENPSDRLEAFGESVTLDWRLYAQDIRGSIAHARALKGAGILSPEDFEKIRKGLEDIGEEIAGGEFSFDPALEDIHMNIEAELTRRIGEAGARLHTARSRNDQVALDLRLWVRDSVEALDLEIAGLQRALVGLGGRHATAVMPGYTHLQRAQPVLFAHHLLAYVEMLARDRSRLRDCVERMNVMPLGSGALAGSTISLDRAAIAGELGFARVSENSMDAVSDRDFVVEALAALALLSVHISRLGEDVILWTSAEFGFLRLSDRHTTGSSLMPQKKNPDIAELARGKSGRVVGNLVAVLTLLKGLPLTYNRDMQEDKRPLFDSFETVFACVGIFAEMFEAAIFEEGRALEAASDPHLLATDLADRLVVAGIPFRKAHEAVGRLVALAAERGVPLDRLENADYASACPALGADAARAVFDLDEGLAARKTPGSPSPENVKSRLDHWHSLLG